MTAYTQTSLPVVICACYVLLGRRKRGRPKMESRVRLNKMTEWNSKNAKSASTSLSHKKKHHCLFHYISTKKISRANHGDFESWSTWAQHVSQWYPAVLQDNISSGWGPDAQFVFLFPQRKPWVWHGDKESTDSLQNRNSIPHHYRCTSSLRWERGNVLRHALCFSVLSVVAKTMAAEASQLLVIQALVPFTTHSSPSWCAVVEAAPASLPLPGILIQLL